MSAADPQHPRLCSILSPSLAFCHGFLARRPLARILSTFLCSLIIAIRPFAHFGGPFAFLVLALKELVFSVQENLSQQLELTCLNIIGALLGIGLSTLAKYIASLAGRDTDAARATCFVFLILISFLGAFISVDASCLLLWRHSVCLAGVIKSRLIRLQLSTRMSCFISVWILTSNIGVSEVCPFSPNGCDFLGKLAGFQHVLPDSGNFLWVTLSAAVICVVSLLAMMVFFPGSTTNFELETAATFNVLHECLSTSLYRVGAHETKNDVSYYRKLHSQLLQRSIKLNESYSQAAFELRLGRLSRRFCYRGCILSSVS